MYDIFQKYIQKHLAIQKDCKGECAGDNDNCEKCRVLAAHRDLREKLKDRLSIMEEVDSSGDEDIYSFLTGSYKRGTIIRPPKDVDFFNVLKEDDYKNFTPSEALNILYAALTDIYPDKEAAGEIRPQTHSITVVYSDTFSIDVIPAFEDGKTYRIPHVPLPGQGEEKWLISNPKVHEKIVHEANEKTGGKLIPIVKLIKDWKRTKCKPKNIGVTSFHLELLATQILGTKEIESIDAGLAKFFTQAPNFMNEPCISDPANTDNLVDEDLTDNERKGLKALLTSEAEVAEEAVQAEKDGKHDEAILKWEQIFISTEFHAITQEKEASRMAEALRTGNLYQTGEKSELTILPTKNETDRRIPRTPSWGE